MSTPSSKPRVAVIGLGLMGSGMARRLLGGGFPVTVFNRNAAKSAPFAAEGASVAASPREAAARADIVISMVADDNAARSMWLDGNGVLAGAAPGTVLIESSTVSVGWIAELGAAAAARGCELLDAPVTGSRIHAASGELNFLVGGNPATLEKALGALAVMSKTITLLGPLGSGARLKLINNFMCGVQIASVAEAITMIERGGLDRTKALEVLLGGAPGSPLVKTMSGRMTAQDYTPNFVARLMAKDLGYAIKEAGLHSLDLLTAAAALKVFQAGIAAGHGEKDMSAIVEQFRPQK